jgi:cyclopropane-fatty-acyl-phospholipid synthase
MKSMVQAKLAAAADRCGLPFAVRFSDGRHLAFRPGEPAFTLVFRNARAERRTALFGYIGLLESYFDGDVDVEGSLRQAFAVGLSGRLDKPNWLVRLRNWWHELRFSNASWNQAKKNAQFHYALGTPFYRLWLDEALMMYTCAYWKEGTKTVEEAQVNKVEHVCRKIRLSPGETVIDIDCGFGGFMFHAEQYHGAKVTGINTTTHQVEMVRDEIRKRHLERSVEIIETDFRDARRQYDKVVSIGTLEHAGRDQLREVIRAHAAFLKPGGIGLLHFIGHVGMQPTDFFIRKHVFPGGWIPSLAETIVEMEDAGLEIIDIENLRRHYALTLDAWVEKFERNWEKIHALDPQTFDERFRRVWLAYLYGCAEMFRSPAGRTHLFQIVFSKGNVTNESYPMTRAHLYEQHAEAGEIAAQRARKATSTGHE